LGADIALKFGDLFADVLAMIASPFHLGLSFSRQASKLEVVPSPPDCPSGG